MMNVTINEKMNGIELRFYGKPEQDVLSALKANGFRWSNRQKMWYAKNTDERMEFVSSLDDSDVSFDGKEKTNSSMTYDLWEMTRVDGLVPGKSYSDRLGSGMSCKEIAAIIRKHIRARFPMCKFSVTSDHDSIHIDLLAGPWAKDSDETAAIAEYVYRFTKQYNYDNSDSMSDYFDVGFYGVYGASSILSYCYEQREQTVAEMNMAADFQKKAEQFAIEEAEREKLEMERRMKEYEIEREKAAIRAEEEKREIAAIEAGSQVSECDFWCDNLWTTNVNKLDSVASYDRYRDSKENGIEINRETCHVVRGVLMEPEAYELFAKHLLSDFSFLEHMGGTSTDDLRITSDMDYIRMDKAERESVKFYCDKCVAIYCAKENSSDCELKMVIDPQGFSYARYVYFVDDESCVDCGHDAEANRGITMEELEANKFDADCLDDASVDIIMDNDMIGTWNKDRREEYKIKFVEYLKEHPLRFDAAVVRALDNMELKEMLYDILNSPLNVAYQFSIADLKVGDKFSLFRIGDFGMFEKIYGVFVGYEIKKYAQYDNAVCLQFKRDNGRKVYQMYLYRDCLIYKGWHELPEELFWEELESSTGLCTIKHGKFMSCDTQQYDVTMEYLAEKGFYPVVNTYKPIFKSRV